MRRNEGKKAKKRGLGIEPKIIFIPKTDYDYQNKNYCFLPAFIRAGVRANNTVFVACQVKF